MAKVLHPTALSEPLTGSVNRKSPISKTAKPASVKSLKTFKKKTVEEQFSHFLQLSCPEQKSALDLSLEVKRLLAEKVEFIASERFSEPSAEGEILGDSFLGTGIEQSPVKASKVAALPPHLARLCEAKLLSPDEERSLFHRMNYLRFRAEQLRATLNIEKPNCWNLRRIEGLLKAADWYRDFIVKSNMRLVISIVKKFVNLQNGFDDLLSDGIIALLRAVDKFDVGLGFRFSTYATQVVRRNSYRRVMEKQAERQRNTGSIHENGIDISDDQKESSMSESRWNELRSRLSTMLDDLDRREKFIIRARFSLGGHRRIQTLQRLADKLGVSKERIRQLEKRALDKLRGMVDLTPLSEPDV
ncbi:MAG: sigma-70 family RNA polymerase sigma factor [Planctomycetota bacterium]|nr:sigma-70 family RNA polymerase sigma factor [Planctomycetota bacterium]